METNPTFPTSLPFSAWVRKEHLSRADGSTKNVTNGTRVLVSKGGLRRLSTGRVSSDLVGVVVETGTACPWAAKRATGTTRAMKVEWSLPLSAFVDGAYPLPTVGEGDEPAPRLWGGLLDGRWVYDDGDAPDVPGAFLSEEDARNAVAAVRDMKDAAARRRS